MQRGRLRSGGGGATRGQDERTGRTLRAVARLACNGAADDGRGQW